MSDENDIFSDHDHVNWRHYLTHGGYYVVHCLKIFFRNPFKVQKRDLDILAKVDVLLDAGNTPENISMCKELIKQHRTIENTRARRRLERWSLWIIAIYLLIVLCVIVLSYSKCPFIVKYGLNIPESIMIAILTTTTVNIIGLGLIVLRGHFLAKEDDRNNE
jgi:hypothetical protein